MKRPLRPLRTFVLVVLVFVLIRQGIDMMAVDDCLAQDGAWNDMTATCDVKLPE